jgi:phosphoribosylglycinamide formyltransferase 1
MRRMAILASGTGTNAENIIRHVSDIDGIEVSMVLSNKADAPVLGKARALGVRTHAFDRSQWQGDHVLQLLRDSRTDVLVLAGFLLLVPPKLIEAYPERIINIHPSLLPKHGGKGMYGKHVHQAVKDSGDTETGVTVHLVDAEYDKGRILFQAHCPVLPDDTPTDIALRAQQLEHQYFAKVVCDYVLSL